MKELSFTLFLDESGDSTIYSEESYLINPSYETHCTLVGTIIGHNKNDFIKTELNKIKSYLWNSKKVIFHSVEIRHRQNAFAIFQYKPELYKEFKDKMNNLTTNSSPVIICSSLNKRIWVNKYPKKLYFKDDPYEQAFIYLLERYAHFLNNQCYEIARGKIIAENRGNNKNKSLELVYKYIKEHGTQYQSKEFFNKLSDKMEFYKKEFNICGLQLADYFCYPFYVNHKYPKRDNKHYDFLQNFVYTGEFNNYGHKKWPI